MPRRRPPAEIDTSETLRAVFEASPAAIALLDAGGAVRMWSVGAERLFGWREQEVLGRRNPIVPAAATSAFTNLLARALCGERLVDIETQRQTKDGELIDVSFSVAPVYDSGRKVIGAVDVYVDIRDRKRAAADSLRQREALARSEKLAALGRLAAGAAHELKNPLAVIAAGIELMRAEVPTDTPLARYFSHVVEATHRMRSITEGLSGYSKLNAGVCGRLDVRSLLTAAHAVVGHLAKMSRVTVVVDAAETLPFVRADRSRMIQVLVNLATNAVEAMAETGGGQLALRARVEADRVLIEVADTGPGIPADRLTTIWDAFYTTKTDGTGLGLSIVRGIVDELDGATIVVKSELGRGATFTITLPVAGVATIDETAGDPAPPRTSDSLVRQAARMTAAHAASPPACRWRAPGQQAGRSFEPTRAFFWAPTAYRHIETLVGTGVLHVGTMTIASVRYHITIHDRVARTARGPLPGLRIISGELLGADFSDLLRTPVVLHLEDGRRWRCIVVSVGLQSALAENFGGLM